MKKGFSWIGIIFIGIVAVIGLFYLGERFKNTVTAKRLVLQYVVPEVIEDIGSEYDVIVIGGEPEGVAAAVSAARNGAKTLLIDKRAELGGLFTYGMLNFLDTPRGKHGKSVSEGIFKEWHELVGTDDAFDILAAKAAFKKLVDQEPNLTYSPKTEVIRSTLDHNRVTSVKLSNKFGEYEVKGRAFIDATQDADFATMSNVPYFIGGEDIGIQNKRMAVTLMLHLKNIDWQKVRHAAKSGKFGGAETTNSVIWGFTKLHNEYVPIEEGTRLRGLNLVKIGDEYYINALQIFGVDGLDEASKQEAIERGKRESKEIVLFLQKEFPGFEQAEIIDYPTELYVRETRHIKAEYQLSMADIWANRDHWDSIGIGAYPVDVQAQTNHDYGYVLSSPEQYAIPFRSLVPKKIDGLLVTGRSAGYSSLAAGSARIVPTGMATGEAAGAASALAIKNGVSFREMCRNKEMIKALRTTLDKQGANVKHFKVEYPYKGEWFDDSVQTLMNYGLVVGGYSNDVEVEKPATKLKFANMFKEVIQRVNPNKAKQFGDKADIVYYKLYSTGNDPITRDEVADLMIEVLWGMHGDSNSWQQLIEKGLISEELASKIQDNKELSMKELYAISASLINYLK